MYIFDLLDKQFQGKQVKITYHKGEESERIFIGKYIRCVYLSPPFNPYIKIEVNGEEKDFSFAFDDIEIFYEELSRKECLLQLRTFKKSSGSYAVYLDTRKTCRRVKVSIFRSGNGDVDRYLRSQGFEFNRPDTGFDFYVKNYPLEE